MINTSNEIIGVLGHDSALYGYTGPETTWAIEMNFVMPLVQDRSLDLLTSSLERYHCATDAPSLVNTSITLKPLCHDKTLHIINSNVTVKYYVCIQFPELLPNGLMVN